MRRRLAGRITEILCRSLDVMCAAAGLLILSPVMIGLAALIMWHDGAPVLFGQIRVGRCGRLFRMWKYRTMRAGSSGPNITASGDDRITRFGSFLRRRKLDELPQLFNVLRGDMSLVGPRPEVPEYVRLDAPAWQAVLQVRPGITGLAALIYRDEEKLLQAAADPDALYRQTVLPAKVLLNLRYLRAKSLWRDLRLIGLTIRYSLLPATFDPECIKRTAGLRVSE